MRLWRSVERRFVCWVPPADETLVYTGDMGNTFAAKGFSALPSRPVSWSKNPKS